MEVRFRTDEKFINDLAQAIGVKNASDVTREALTLLNWAIHEVRANRVILSATPDGKDFHRLVMGNWAVTSDNK